MQPDALAERGIQEFDAWAANFGETGTELELQPSGLYKPVTRFCEFVNVPDLMAIFRMVADVVLKSDLRQHLKLPAIAGGQPPDRRRPGEPGLQRLPAPSRRPDQGDRGAAAGSPQRATTSCSPSSPTAGTPRSTFASFVSASADEPANKLNPLIDNVFRIWQRNSAQSLYPPRRRPLRPPGAAQMIFSDLGTLAAEETRGFSAYRWIKDELIAAACRPAEIAFMQDYKKSGASSASSTPSMPARCAS